MSNDAKKPKILITKNGPYQVSGSLPIEKEYIVPDDNGTPLKWKKGEKYPTQESCHLCRCGKSEDKPYCDDSHLKTNFNGTETSRTDKYIDRAERISGPEIDLTDYAELCASAKFCHRAGGIWNLTKKADKKSKEIATEEACNCPSGRLVAWDKSGKPIEPKFDPSISLIEDPIDGVSGPLWIKGGIEIESESGKKYEKRNRITLCRCGHSASKPFCDGTHIDVKFNDSNKKPAK